MNGIIVCEESQEVTMAFNRKGHYFHSCDLQDCSGGYPEWHIKDDCFRVLSKRIHIYDFIGAHPPCTYLTNSSVGWLVSNKQKPGFIWSDELKKYYNPKRWELMEDAAIFFKSLYSCLETIGKGYIENPIMHKYAMDIIGVKHTQIIQPWMFGCAESKSTCLWIVGLPPLQWYDEGTLFATSVKTEFKSLPKHIAQRLHYLPPSKDRAKLRSKTYPGIAKAMAEQWGI